MADTAQRLAKILREHTGFMEVEPQDNSTLKMVDDLHLDSLDMVEITMALEDEFGLAIDDEAAEPFVSDRGGAGGKTFADWVAWVEGLIAAK